MVSTMQPSREEVICDTLVKFENAPEPLSCPSLSSYGRPPANETEKPVAPENLEKTLG